MDQCSKKAHSYDDVAKLYKVHTGYYAFQTVYYEVWHSIGQISHSSAGAFSMVFLKDVENSSRYALHMLNSTPTVVIYI